MATRISTRYFSADVTDVNAMAATLQGAVDPIVKQEMRLAAGRSTKHVEREANALLHSHSGLMAKSWRWVSQLTGNTFVFSVRNVAKSAGGFSYPIAVEFGRKAFGPVHAKVLRFTIGGRTIFTRWVKAAPAQHVLERGAITAQPSVEAEFAAARDRIAQRIEAQR